MADYESPKLRSRFFAKVGPPTEPLGCTEWQASRARSGHGFFGVEGINQPAHRVAWILANGPVPPDLHIDHFVCDNPPCVNPAHLKAVTPRENTLRSLTSPSAVNARKTECVRGHPLSGDNLHVAPDGRRICKECKRLENISDRSRARKAAWYRAKHGKAVS